MADQSHTQKVLDELADRAARRASYRQISLSMKRHAGWLWKVVTARSQLTVPALFEVLDSLEIEPRVFFRAAFKTVATQPSDLLAYLREQSGSPASPFLDRAIHLAKDLSTAGAAVGRDELYALDELKYANDLSRALVEVEAAIASAAADDHLVLFCARLGTWGSICRRLGRRHHANSAYCIALEKMETFAVNRWLHGRLLQKSSYLLRDANHLDEALFFLEKAGEAFLLVGEMQDFGSTLVGKGAALGHRADYERSIESFQAALHFLPRSSWQNRVSCFQGIAVGFLHLGALDDSGAFLDRAFEAARDDKLVNARLLWCRADLDTRRKNYSNAERDLAAAASAFDAAGRHIDRALVGVDLFNVYLKTQNLSRAKALAREVLTWLPLFSENPIAHAALMNLYSGWIRGELTEPLMEGVRAQLRRSKPSAVSQ